MPGRKPDWLTPEVQKRLREILYEYHVRIFGEEMARVNFLPKERRKAYIHDMIDHARKHGVKFEKEALGVTR
jgi:hypothetical protein